jgi:hypothetical protein
MPLPDPTASAPASNYRVQSARRQNVRRTRRPSLSRVDSDHSCCDGIGCRDNPLRSIRERRSSKALELHIQG